MKPEEPTSERAVLHRAIEVITEHLPAEWIVNTEDQTGSEQFDSMLNVSIPDGVEWRIALQTKRIVDRRYISTIVDKLSQTTSERITPVLAAKYLSPQVRADLTDKGVGYVDATGNIRITASTPAVFLSDRGEDRDPWRRAGRPRGTLRGEPAARVVRALVDFEREWGARELIEISGASTGATYRVLEYLQQEELVQRDARGVVRVPDWRRLIETWAEDAPFLATNRAVKFIEPRGLDAFLARLDASNGVRYAVTGTVAAAEWAPFAPARVAYVYVDSVEAASQEWKLHPSESSPNVVLLEPRKTNDVAFDRTSTSSRGFNIAAPAQVAVDLWNGPGRNPSEAAELLSWMSANEEVWRK